MVNEEITAKILAACFEVTNELGAGFLESVYQNALMLVLQEKGLTAQREYPLAVTFRTQNIGQFYADILVENKIILELKAVSALTEIHKAQLINYLKATGLETGLLINFGNPKLEYRRFDNRFIKKISPLSPSSL
ncbi:MAG: GxxExxY protein [Chloroflexi bacterium]|nr:GxxExxY protein [Chloroflexota bacterium]